MVLCTLSITVQQQQQQSCPSNSGSSQGCLAKQCLACANAPANCTVHQTNGTVRCSGDTSTCSVITCDSCSHCGSYYFKSSDNHVDYRFTSGCISNDPTYTCDSSTYACVGSGLVMNESALFSSSPISCSCLASNCTANLSFTYIVNTTQPAQATSFPGPTMITYPISKLVVLLCMFIL